MYVYKERWHDIFIPVLLDYLLLSSMDVLPASAPFLLLQLKWALKFIKLKYIRMWMLVTLFVLEGSWCVCEDYRTFRRRQE